MCISLCCNSTIDVRQIKTTSWTLEDDYYCSSRQDSWPNPFIPPIGQFVRSSHKSAPCMSWRIFVCRTGHFLTVIIICINFIPVITQDFLTRTDITMLPNEVIGRYMFCFIGLQFLVLPGMAIDCIVLYQHKEIAGNSTKQSHRGQPHIVVNQDQASQLV